MAAVIELENVTKQFGPKKAVDNISLTIEQGSVVALLGPNGAGKSTTVQMMLGLQKPTSGRVRLLGGDPQDPRHKNRIGAMLQDVSVIERLTVKETIHLFRHYYKKSLGTSELLRIAGLEKEANVQSQKLSGGQKRRLNFALAMAGDPDVLFVDEPTVGMDVTARQMFWETLRNLANGGRTIVMTTHYLEEADAIADRVVVIDQGKKLADGTPGALKTALGGRHVSFIAGARLEPSMLNRLPNVEQVEWSGRHVRIRTKDSDQILRVLIKNDWDVRDVEVTGGGLNDVFSNLVESKGGEIA